MDDACRASGRPSGSAELVLAGKYVSPDEARALADAGAGVIGETLPDDRIRKALGGLKKKLAPSDWPGAATAIMTTDTFPKGAAASCMIDGKEVKIAGFAKGSGMIAPDMATMLAFIFTDVAIPASILQQLLSDANERSFNCVTVDSDTSTSDTALLFATGRAQNDIPATSSDDSLADFKRGLLEVMTDLAQQVARDGEGASKFITVKVTGAESDSAAKTIALAIANSPLVKTAVAFTRKIFHKNHQTCCG